MTITIDAGTITYIVILTAILLYILYDNSKLPKEEQVPPKVIIVLYLLFSGGSVLFE